MTGPTRHRPLDRSPLRRLNLESLEPRRMLSAAIKPVVSLAEQLADPSGAFSRVAGSTNESLATGDDGLQQLYVPPTKMLQDLTDGYLTDHAQKGKSLDLARAYLLDHAADLGLTNADVVDAIVTNQYSDANTGVTHIYMRQTANGLPIINADLGIHLARDGRIINVSSSFVKNVNGDGATVDGLNQIVPAAAGPVANPHAKLLPDEALSHAASALGRTLKNAPGQVKKSDQAYELTSAEISLDKIPLQLEYVATADGLTLAWDMVVRPPKMNDDWYDMAVDGDSGGVVFASNWTDHLAQYNVYPLPTEAPNDGPRQLVSDPSNALASPFGWHDTNGVAGPEFTDTRGNNVSAQEDANADNAGGFRPDGGASLNFDFPLDLTQAPGTYQSAAITNLFYWVNILHDVHYQYGFNEAAGNFQVNNYGRGGSGNDPVQADAQDGSGTNNANFSTPPDGASGRMQMYLWTSTSPSRDGDFDATIMAHEFGHGVSNRLTGGPGNASALDALQSGGMGEGWSDFWSLMFTQKPSDAYATAAFPVATYVRGQTTSGSGLRRKPYSFDMTIDPLTIDAYGTSGTTSYGIARSNEVHATGELWCTALWDMAVLLENKYGYDSNLYTGYTATPGPGHAGNKLAWQLVLDAMKLQPANPSLAQARDAILQADRILTGGANKTEIWTAFARRGMGFSFDDGGSSSSTTVTPAFNMPVDDPVIIRQLPLSNRPKVAQPTSMTFSFSEAINPASFSLADDVNFRGPGNVNLNSLLTSFSFGAGNSDLTVNFTAPASTVGGTYTMTLGPNILAADDGDPMDQNLNNVPGEAADTFAGTYTYYTPRITDAGFGYQAGQWAFENLDLVPGAPGVTSLLTSSDDATAVIPMGTNSFNLYGTTYSATSGSGSVNVTDNGFLSFATPDAASTAYQNTDLTSPVAARFAALWDDWYTQVDANDQVLYRFDDLNADGISDRLVVEWNGVHSTSGGSGVTFQAILQLNTGATPGVMIANYPDVTSDNAGVSNGGSATVGIKSVGTPPANRLLVAQDDGAFPWVGDGKAIRIATDWTAPTVTAFAYNYSLAVPTATIDFSEDVGASLTKADLTITNTTTGQTIPATNYALSYTAATKRATVTFPGYPQGLPDGNYTVSLNPAGVSDAQWNPLSAASSTAQPFFVLAGDANRDRHVDLTDFTFLAANFNGTGKTFDQGDFDYSGTVDLTDFTVLAAHFNQTLAGDAVASAAPIATTAATTSRSPAAAAPFSQTTLAVDSRHDDLLGII